jgi:hypothetical protein
LEDGGWEDIEIVGRKLILEFVSCSKDLITHIRYLKRL